MSFTLIMYRLLPKMFTDLNLTLACFCMNSCFQSHLPTAPKPVTKKSRLGGFLSWERFAAAVVHLLQVTPSSPEKSVCENPAQGWYYTFPSILWSYLTTNTIYRIIRTMGFGIQDRPEVVGYISFIFTLDSNGRSADIFCCSVNKLLRVLL